MTHTQHGLSSCTVGPNADAYSYEPLLDEDQIRILTLHPSTDPDAPLTGELGVESLDLTTDHYDAISYVWGDPTRTHGLQIPTASISPPHLVNLPLTRSVHDALHRLRLPNQPRRLWADQVCINQDDVAERSRQVRLMNRIYRGASEVLVWLGPDDEGVAPGAFRIVRELEEVFGNEEKMEVFRREHLEELAERNAEAWKPLSRLTKLPWVSNCPHRDSVPPASIPTYTQPVQPNLDRPRDRHSSTSNSLLGQIRLSYLDDPLLRQLHPQPGFPPPPRTLSDLHSQHHLPPFPLRSARSI